MFHVSTASARASRTGPDLSLLSHAEKNALIRALWQRLDGAERRIEELEAKLGEPPKTPDNSSVPSSKGQKANQPEKAERQGLRRGSQGRKGGGRPLTCDPDETVIAKAVCCAHCQTVLTDADHVLHGRYDKVDLPVVRPVVTRVERYAGHCPCCHGVTLAAVPEGMEEGTPFSVNIMLRFANCPQFLGFFLPKLRFSASPRHPQRARDHYPRRVAAQRPWRVAHCRLMLAVTCTLALRRNQPSER